MFEFPSNCTIYIYIYIYIYIRDSFNIKGRYFEKKISLEFFPYECKLCILWNWFRTKITLISIKYVFGLFIMTSNPTYCTRFNQRSVITFLVSKECKPCKICRRMYNEYNEACFSLQLRTLIECLLLWVWVEKTVYGVETECLSAHEKVSALLSRMSWWRLSETWKG